MAHLVADVQAGLLDLELAQAGPDDGVGRHWTQWPFYGLPAVGDDWGARELGQIWTEVYGDREGVILTVWDAGRCFSLLTSSGLGPQVQWWGYVPVDARTRRGPFGGPGADAMRHYARVLGYGRWGAEVLRGVRGEPVSYLPHGIDLEMFQPPTSWEPDEETATILGRRSANKLVIGCVAANQPRKDLGLYCETLRTLLDRGLPIFGWLHTDISVGPGWAIPQLVTEYGLQKALRVTTSLEDQQLAALYRRCCVTIAPGLGEGFGYPIVESLACGTPVIHGTYGGGAELVPRSEWKVPVRAERVEGGYALVRPVYTAEDVANAVERAMAWRGREAGNGVVEAYCAGAVSHLGWERIWPRWRSWITQGVEGF
jgi:glycosyltransferase involved in cell wall biosynthesis